MGRPKNLRARKVKEEGTDLGTRGSSRHRALQATLTQDIVLARDGL